MVDEVTLKLAAAVADPATRAAGAAALAAHAGATALLVLVEDAAVDALVPAPGFPQTLPGGRAWREFLDLTRRPGIHRGTVGYPVADHPVAAVASAGAGIVAIFLGNDCDSHAVERISALLPLLAAVMRAEQAMSAAAGELLVAQHTARQADALARALDAARTEVEGALQKLERQAQSLEEARARAEEATRAKDEFLAMLGHELRNPLSPIMTALQLMRLKGESSRELNIIERQMTNLKSLVDDLLDISRITGGKIELRKERLELADAAARAIEVSSPMLERKRQTLELAIPPNGLPLDADPSRLVQILSNLLTNAAKYSNAGTRIDFIAERAGPSVRIRVRDQGIGLEPEMCERIFDRFVQQRQSADRSEGGLGLGLAIVRSLVTMHGGTVRAQSAGIGKGSEFIVELPAAPAGEPYTPPPVSALAETLSVRASNAERVLVVDDNDDAGMMLSEALDSLGYSVRTASDGPQALRVAAAFRPQIALLDIGLPVMDGYELAQRLRQLSGGEPLCLIAVTGYGQPADKLRTEAGGFNAHLVKPVALEQLSRVLRGCASPGSPA